MTSSFDPASGGPGPKGEGGDFQPFQWSSADPAVRKVVSQAERIMEEAKQGAQAIEHEAFQKGFEEGQRQGVEMGMRKLEPIVKSLGEASRSLQEDRSLWFWECEKDLVELALAVARCLVNHEISTSPAAVGEMVKMALQEVESTHSVSLHIHPEDWGLLSEGGAGEGVSAVEIPSRVQVVEDESVGRGGCLVRSDMGSIDGRLEEQFAALMGRLEDELERHRPGARSESS